MPDTIPIGAAPTQQPQSPANAPRLDDLTGWLSHFVSPGDVTELIAFDSVWEEKPCKTVCGFFDHANLRNLARNALRLSGQSKGVYITLNPLKPAVLQRRRNCMGVKSKGVAATDNDVLHRRWIFLDIDPVRGPEESSTDAEKLAAWNLTADVRTWLADRWGPPDIVGDSGNGYHLLYRLAEPLDVPLANDPTAQLLLALSDHFSTAEVSIDVKVSNPGRIIKCPGTQTRKGRATKARPHRWSWIVETNPRIKLATPTPDASCETEAATLEGLKVSA